MSNDQIMRDAHGVPMWQPAGSILMKTEPSFIPGTSFILKKDKFYTEGGGNVPNPYGNDIPEIIERSDPFLFCKLKNEFYTFIIKDSEGRDCITTGHQYREGISNDRERAHYEFSASVQEHENRIAKAANKVRVMKEREAYARLKTQRIAEVQKMKLAKLAEIKAAVKGKDIAKAIYDKEVQGLAAEINTLEQLLKSL